MIQHFNFFDIYGYLIPGGVWLALMWFPFASRSGFPLGTTAEFTVVGLLGSYVAGHLLYGMARNLFPTSKYREAPSDEERPLSYCLLDQNPGRFSPPVKPLSSPVRNQLAYAIKKRFDIDVADGVQRESAFFLCRAALAQGKVSSYVEQYQGLNALTRGLAAACVLAVAFYFGWVLAAAFPSMFSRCPQDGPFSPWLALLIALGPLVPFGALYAVERRFIRKGAKGEKWLAGVCKGRIRPLVFALTGDGRIRSTGFALLLIAGGFFANRCSHGSSVQAYQLAAAGSVLLIAQRLFAIAAKAFDDAFAAAVYRDFVVLATIAK